MKALQTLTTAAGIILAISGPSLAASYATASGHRDANTTRGYRDPVDPPAAYRPGYNAFGSAGANWWPESAGRYQYAPGNLP